MSVGTSAPPGLQPRQPWSTPARRIRSSDRSSDVDVAHRIPVSASSHQLAHGPGAAPRFVTSPVSRSMTRSSPSTTAYSRSPSAVIRRRLPPAGTSVRQTLHGADLPTEPAAGDGIEQRGDRQRSRPSAVRLQCQEERLLRPIDRSRGRASDQFGELCLVTSRCGFLGSVAGGLGFPVGPLLLGECDTSGHESDDQCCRRAGDQSTQAADPPLFAAAFRLGLRLRRFEELVIERSEPLGTPSRQGAALNRAALPDRRSDGLPTATVPHCCGDTDRSDRAAQLAVLDEPVAQARPVAEQRLVRDLDRRFPSRRIAVGAEQSGSRRTRRGARRSARRHRTRSAALADACPRRRRRMRRDGRRCVGPRRSSAGPPSSRIRSARAASAPVRPPSSLVTRQQHRVGHAAIEQLGERELQQRQRSRAGVEAGDEFGHQRRFDLDADRFGRRAGSPAPARRASSAVRSPFRASRARRCSRVAAGRRSGRPAAWRSPAAVTPAWVTASASSTRKRSRSSGSRACVNSSSNWSTTSRRRRALVGQHTSDRPQQAARLGELFPQRRRRVDRHPQQRRLEGVDRDRAPAPSWRRTSPSGARHRATADGGEHTGSDDRRLAGSRWTDDGDHRTSLFQTRRGVRRRGSLVRRRARRPPRRTRAARRRGCATGRCQALGVGRVPPTCGSRAAHMSSTNEATVAYRSPAALAVARARMSSTAGGRSVRVAPTGGNGSDSWRRTRSARSRLSANGRRPVSTSNVVTARLRTSAGAPAGSPRSTSGAA